MSIHAAIKSNKERRVVTIEEVLASSLRPSIQRQAATECGDQTLRFVLRHFRQLIALEKENSPQAIRGVTHERK